MSDAQGNDAQTLTKTETVFLAEYAQVCGLYKAVDDFRGKILAFLPIASGAGGLLLLRGDGTTAATTNHLVPIGVFGLIVTLGLGIYELRCQQLCCWAIALGRRLEVDLKLDRDSGLFCGLPKAYFSDWMGHGAAALVIYDAVLLGWVYIILIGLGRWSSYTPVSLAGGYLVLLGLGWGWALLQPQAEPDPKCPGADGAGRTHGTISPCDPITPDTRS